MRARSLGFLTMNIRMPGAEIVGEAGHVWANAETVVKVKEPVESEYVFFREGLVLFTYLHLAPLPGLTDALLKAKVIGIAYETVRDRANTLPLLTPMSEVAGRMSVQVGASYLEKEKRVAAGFCWAVCRVCRRRMCASLAAGSWARMRPRSPLAWARM
jgi:alanine dehydrogenase